jgi:hypothetical protein
LERGGLSDGLITGSHNICQGKEVAVLARFVLSAIVLFLLLPGSPVCSAGADDTYFPLKQGMTWEYRSSSDKKDTRTITITNLAPRKENDTTVTPRKWETDGRTIRIDLVAQDDGGVYLYGEQPSEKAQPTIIQPKSYYIPRAPADGTSWEIKTKLGNDNVVMTLTIESINDTVTVPAGTYKDCVKIKHVGSSAPGEKKDTELSVLAYEWYAPKVGWIKSLVTVNRKSKEGTILSEHENYQLLSFKP